MQLTINHVSKHYKQGKKAALDNINLELTPGVYGILGPNGSGKSTLMNIITDNLLSDTGEVSFNHTPIRRLGKAYREILGYMPQQQGLYDDFTGHRFLWYMAALKDMKKEAARTQIDDLLQIVNLQQDAHKKLGSYSGGMKQRIMIAQALLNDPKIVLLDEPTAGLDPKERIRIRNFISAISSNKIILIATHVVSDIESIAKQIIFLKHGKIVLQNDPYSLLEWMKDKVYTVYVSEKNQLESIEKRYKVSNITNEKEGICVRIVGDHPPENLAATPVKPNLEDVYLYLFEQENVSGSMVSL